MEKYDGKQFINALLELNEDEYDSLREVLDRIDDCKKYEKALEENNVMVIDDYKTYYSEEKYNLPNNTNLSIEEINRVIRTIKKIRGNYHNEDGLKIEIIEYIFQHISDESKIAYFRSKEFLEFYDIFNRETYKASEYIKTIQESISKEKREKIYKGMVKKDIANIKLRLGDLGDNEIIENIISLFDKNDYYKEQTVKILEYQLALKDIDVDLSSFDADVSQKDLVDSDIFKQAINNYYNTLTEQEKYEFYDNLASERTWKDKYYIFFDSQPEEMQKRLKILSLIENEEKYDLATLNVLFGVLEFNSLEKSNDIINSILNIYNRSDHWSRRENMELLQSYFVSIQENERPKFDVSIEELKNLIDKKEIDKNSMIVMGILSCLKEDKVKEYLLTKPSDFLETINSLNMKEANEVLSQINSEYYKAQLLLNINSDANIISDLFPQLDDDFVISQIVIAKSNNNRFVSNEHTLQNIDEFLRIKDEFLQLPENQRTQFLCEMTKKMKKDDEDIFAHIERNEIKQSLLGYIENSEDRNKVINSFECYIDNDIFKYVEITNTMIREFLEQNCNLSEEEQERLNIALNSYDVFFENYDEYTQNGKCSYIEKNISLANHRRGDIENIIIDLLHERAHSFANLNFIKCGITQGKTFEEGIADTFAELVSNWYFTKYKQIEIDGEIYTPQLPLISSSGYHFENGWVKSMLYPLEKENKDKLALQKFLFGDKKEFFNLCIKEGFAEKFQQNYLGMPKNIEVGNDELLDARAESYVDLNEESLYMIKNDKIKELSEMAQQNLIQNGITTRLIEQEIAATQISQTAKSFMEELQKQNDKDYEIERRKRMILGDKKWKII